MASTRTRKRREPVELPPITEATLLTRAQAATYLGISEWAIHQFTTHRAANDNPLPVRKAGRRDIYLIAELLEWTAREERRSERSKARRKQRRKSPQRVGR